jgi:hypothetical protein
MMKKISIFYIVFLLSSIAKSQEAPRPIYPATNRDSCIRILIDQCLLKEFLIQDFLLNSDEIIGTYSVISYLKSNKQETERITRDEEYTFYTLSMDSIFHEKMDSLHKLLPGMKYTFAPIFAWFANAKSITIVIHYSYNTVTLYRLSGFVHDDKEILINNLNKGDRRFMKSFMNKYKKYFQKE